MRILCGTDFCQSAADAATIAALWSHRSGGNLHLIHACPANARDEIPAYRERLTAEARRLAELGADITAADVVLGQPEETLIQEATHRGAGLLVLGAVGRRGNERWLTGSVAVRVARDAPMPVLVVRQSERLEAWLRGEGRLRVLTGFERGESTCGALRWAADLARLGQTEFTVVHLVVPGPENRRAHVVGPGMGLVLQPETERQLLEELRGELAKVIGDVPVNPIIKVALGRRDVHLVMEGQDLASDLIVVGSHQRHGFQRWWTGSVSSGVLNAAEVSVTVVPSRAAAG